MRLEGIHHVTMITGDAPGNVDFYTRVLGLRLVAKTVNQDDPNVYHLFYADEHGSPGTEMTFFEYPGARPGRAGAGMVHTHRLARRLRRRRSTSGPTGSPPRASRPSATATGCASPTPRASATSWPSTPAPSCSRHEHPEIPARARARRRDRRPRATASRPEASARLLEGVLGATPAGDGAWELRGDERAATITFDPPDDPRHPRRRHRPPRRLGHDRGRAPALARAPGRRAACARRP